MLPWRSNGNIVKISHCCHGEAMERNKNTLMSGYSPNRPAQNTQHTDHSELHATKEYRCNAKTIM